MSDSLKENDLKAFLDFYDIDVTDEDLDYLINLVNKERLTLHDNRCYFMLNQPVKVGDSDDKPLEKIDLTPKTAGVFLNAVNTRSQDLDLMSKITDVPTTYLRNIPMTTMNKISKIFDIFFRQE